MMLNKLNNKIGFILNLMGLVNCIIACFISIIVLIRIICYFCFNRMKLENRITILLCTYIYLLILIYVLLLGSMNVHALLGDLYKYHFYSSWCIFRGYFITVILTVLYCVCINQAFYRYCRIVYSTYRWLQLFWLYALIPPIELILSFGLFYPLVLWNSIVYLPAEHYCYVSFMNYRGMLWIMFVGYGIPLLFLSYIYIRLTLFVHRYSKDQAFILKRRQERDLFVFRRILFNILILFSVGIPSVILLIMLIITGEEDPLIFRISLLSASTSMVGLSVSMIFLTTPLKNIVLRKNSMQSDVTF